MLESKERKKKQKSVVWCIRPSTSLSVVWLSLREKEHNSEQINKTCSHGDSLNVFPHRYELVRGRWTVVKCVTMRCHHIQILKIPSPPSLQMIYLWKCLTLSLRSGVSGRSHFIIILCLSSPPLSSSVMSLSISFLDVGGVEGSERVRLSKPDTVTLKVTRLLFSDSTLC